MSNSLEPFFTKPGGELDIEYAEEIMKNPPNQYMINKAYATLEENSMRIKQKERAENG